VAAILESDSHQLASTKAEAAFRRRFIEDLGTIKSAKACMEATAAMEPTYVADGKSRVAAEVL
jgi:hypothetical protein